MIRLATIASLLLALAATAAPPQAKTQPPGYYRHMLGDFEITCLLDGTAAIEVDKLTSNPLQVREALAWNRLAPMVELSVNAFLIHTGDKLVLVDAGAGSVFGARCGHLVENLRAAGYQPEQIDAVLITHMHGDHSAGLVTSKGERVFPNASVYMDKRESEFWLSDAEAEKAPADRRGGFKAAHTALDPYSKADKLKPFDGSRELFPGIRAVSAYGHTPGHTVYLAESKGHKLLVWGDSLHVAEAQFPDPSITITFDTDQKAAAAARLKLLADADKEGQLIAGAHLSFPGLGRVRAEGKGYRWIPLPYSAGAAGK